MNENPKRRIPRTMNPGATTKQKKEDEVEIAVPPVSATPSNESTEPNEQTVVPTMAEQNVLDKLHQTTAKHKAENTRGDTATLEIFHKEIEQCECYPLLLKYTSGQIPSLQRMFANIDKVSTQLQKLADEEASKLKQSDDASYHKLLLDTKNLLAGREAQVRGAVLRYVNSVIRFSRLQKSSMNGIRDDGEQFVKADHARRHAHDNLISSLNTYSALAKKMIDEDLPNTFVFWQHNDDARMIPTDKTIIFDPSVTRNREFIKDWSIVADFVEQMEALGETNWSENAKGRSLR